MRLGDLEEAKKKLFSYYSFVNENTHKSNYMGETLMSYEVADMIKDCISNTPTIDPEALPIVRELREKLEQVTAQRDELFKMLNDVCKDTREQHVDESVCGLCEYDVAYIGQSGDWVNECPGFNSDDCFCMKRSIREKFGQLENMSLYGPDGDHS